MKPIHTEIHFEDDIYNHLTSHSWLAGDAKGYDAQSALYPEDALGWVRYAYPAQWERFASRHGAKAEEAFLTHLETELGKNGTLHVLRHGFKIAGLGSTPIAMSISRPSSGNNPQTLDLYRNVRCRVVRQVHYSPHRPHESIDLVLFVNGIPVATLELKTDFTQTVHDAMKQYRYDRPVTDPVKKLKEPLLQFKTRCVVHFAVSTNEVYMTTRLEGPATEFLPFNRGDGEGAGNPLNPDGYKTAYLWERVLQRDAWLHILSKFVHLEKNETIIFPRHHQWDAVMKIVSDVGTKKAGAKYLVQHSAGSGKSNSIAWLAHHLATLWADDEKKLFDSVIVITDRTVLDKQLQETVYQFEHKQGVVERITDEGGAKSTQLVLALERKKPIIIVTIQTFGYALEKLGSHEMAGYNFAVIADEAHTSQTGKSAAGLKSVLGFSIDEDEELSMDDILTAVADSRYGRGNISYFAFTATPKAKTMQLFGTPDASGEYRPFHLYSMRQAIEEHFILDVLKGYIPYRIAYKLAHDGKDYDEDTVDKSEASKALTRWVRLHPYNIAQKVKIIVEHFREHVSTRLGGQAKAMVVTGSRLEAVRYKLAMDTYIRAKDYLFGTIVAFSGEVSDQESGDLPFTEQNMNKTLRGRDIRDAFDGPEYQVLIVANKFQTGFDQPKLTAMYVDKQLSGVATVQTLSRLNRTYPGKDWTAIIDFVNDPDQVLKDFQLYYRGCVLPVGSDPQMIIDLQLKLDARGIYHESEVEDFVAAYLEAGPKGLGQNRLAALVGPTLTRFSHQVRDARDTRDTEAMEGLRLFVKDLQSFCSLYDFLSQIIPYKDSDLEKRYIFFKHIIRQMLEILRTEIPKDGGVDLSMVKLTHYAIHRRGEEGDLKLDPMGNFILEAPAGQGTGKAHTKEEVLLSELVRQLNMIFEDELTDNDVINYAEGVRDKVMEDSEVVLQAMNNASLDQFANGKIRQAIPGAIVDMMEVNRNMTRQVMANQDTMRDFAAVITRMVYEAFAERRA